MGKEGVSGTKKSIRRRPSLPKQPKRYRTPFLTRGNVSGFEYDGRGRLLRQYDRLGYATSHEYNNAGQRTATVDPLGRRTEAEYDEHGRVTRSRDTAGNWTEYQYDDNDRLAKTIDPLGQVTERQYDAAGQLERLIDARKHHTTFGYDPLGNRRRLTDPQGNSSYWQYDSLNRLEKSTDPLGEQIVLEYSPVDDWRRRTDRNGREILFELDELGRVQTETWDDGRVLEFDYDSAGRLTWASDPSGAFGFTYDANGRLDVATQQLAALAFPIVLDNDRDLSGNNVQLKILVNGVEDSRISSTYDPRDSVASITHSGNGVVDKFVAYQYNSANQPVLMERFEGPSSSRTLVATTDYAHDSAGRLVSLDHSQGANAIAGYTYGYDTLGRLESFGSLADGSVTYAYDQTSQLTAATGSGTLPDESYRYDGSGNREGSTYHTGTANRVSFDAKYNYQYDNEGNRIRRIERVSGEVTRYHWDHRNRLVMQEHRSETEQLLWRERYSYDGLNRRVERVGDSDGDGVNEQSEYFVNHGLRSDRGGAGDSIALRLDGTGAVIGRELHGPTVDSILAEDRLDPEGGATETLWALTDANGSVRDTVGVDDAGTATIGNHVAYDAFGQMVTQSDASSGSEYGFTGREIESGGLQSNRARIYDAALGRWLSEDPIGFASGQTNLSLYLGNDPISGTDPSGLIDPRNFHPMQEFRVFWAGVYKSFLGGNASPVPGKRITHPHGVGGVVGGVVRYGSLGAASSLTEPAGTRSSYSQSGMELSELPMSFTPLASGYHVLHGESAAGASRNRALAGAELGTWVVGTALGLRQVGRSAGLQRAPVAPKGGTGFLTSPGVTVRKSGNYFIKEVDPNASRLARWHGERSLRYQSEALTKLGDMAPPHLLRNGKLITRDAGTYVPGNFWRTYAKGSWRLGTPVNDIRPHNMGANGLIFDPALDPLVRPLYWGAGVGTISVIGYYTNEYFNGDD